MAHSPTWDTVHCERKLDLSGDWAGTYNWVEGKRNRTMVNLFFWSILDKSH